MNLIAYLQILLLLLRPQRLFSRLYHEPWYRAMLHEAMFIKPSRQGLYLEVGCAAGDFTYELAHGGLRVIGLDRARPPLRRPTASNGYPQFLQADALQLPFFEQTFDAIFAASVINLVRAPETLLIELQRVCKPGGEITVLFPCTEYSTKDVKRYAATMQFTGFAKAALMSWHRLGRKMPTEEVMRIFQDCDFTDIQQRTLLGGMVIAISGRRHA